jgi:hypothetical protein
MTETIKNLVLAEDAAENCGNKVNNNTMEMKFTLYTRKFLGNNARDVEYPIKREIKSALDLVNALQYDHICCKFVNNTRAKTRVNGEDVPAQFEYADVIENDIDNEKHSTADTWITVEDFIKAFHNIKFIIVPSRNNMKVKHPGEDNEQSARPRFHVIMPLKNTIKQRGVYENIKRGLVKDYNEFDSSCTDATRFIYGIENINPSEIVFHDGEFYVDELQWGFKEQDTQYTKKNDSTYKCSMKTKNILDALNYISPEGYDTWLKVGMALYNEGVDCDEWDNWSSTGSTYKPKECLAKWKTFRNDNSRQGLSAGTIFMLAKENGYELPSAGNNEYFEKQMQQCMKEMKEVAISAKEHDTDSLEQHIEKKCYMCDTLAKFIEMCINVLQNYVKVYTNISTTGKVVREIYIWDSNTNRYYLGNEDSITKYFDKIISSLKNKIINNKDLDTKTINKMESKLDSFIKYKNNIISSIIISDNIIDISNKYDAACVYATNDGIIDLRDINTLKNPIKTKFILCRNILDVSLKFDKNIIKEIQEKIINPVFDSAELGTAYIRRVATAWLGRYCGKRNFCDMIQGVGSNGKSKLLTLLSKAFLNFGVNAGPEVIDERLDNTFNAMQKNKRLISIDESNDVTLGVKFKNTVAYDSIIINDKGVSKYSIENNARIIAACNQAPKISGDTAILKRLQMWPSTDTIYDVDRALATKQIQKNEAADFQKKINEYGKTYFNAENNIKHLTAYLLWVAAEEYQNNCTIIDNAPTKVKEFMNIMVAYNASPVDTLNNMYEKTTTENKIPFNDIYQQYVDICEDSNIDAKFIMKKAALIRRLSENFRWNIQRTHGVWYIFDRILVDTPVDPTPDPDKPTKTITEQIVDNKIMQQIQNKTSEKTVKNSTCASEKITKKPVEKNVVKIEKHTDSTLTQSPIDSYIEVSDDELQAHLNDVFQDTTDNNEENTVENTTQCKKYVDEDDFDDEEFCKEFGIDPHEFDNK